MRQGPTVLAVRSTTRRGSLSSIREASGTTTRTGVRSRSSTWLCILAIRVLLRSRSQTPNELVLHRPAGGAFAPACADLLPDAAGDPLDESVQEEVVENRHR